MGARTMLTTGLAGDAAMRVGRWRRRVRTYEPWLLGLAAFVITSVGLLHDNEGPARARLTAAGLHIAGAVAS